jgi:hypothetical protein
MRGQTISLIGIIPFVSQVIYTELDYFNRAYIANIMVGSFNATLVNTTHITVATAIIIASVQGLAAG